MSSEAPGDSVTAASIISSTMASITNVIIDNPKEQVTPIFLQTQTAKGL